MQSTSMNTKEIYEIYSSREMPVAVEKLYEAFANPKYLIQWWGPAGFSNTFHEFDLRPEGKWLLTMHGPEKGNYENAAVFKGVEPNKIITWTRLSQPLFDMEVAFVKINTEHSKISFRMLFQTEAECNKMKPFVLPKNEENFDRLEQVLKTMLA